MSTHARTDARTLRARLKHPVIDAGGHGAELPPLMREELRRVGEDVAVEALEMASALNALFSSDIGHFDVPDMSEVVPEAHDVLATAP